MAEISTNVYDSSDVQNAQCNGVFINAQTGYIVYINENRDLVYQKTLNGGNTWGTAVTIREGTAWHYNVWWGKNGGALAPDNLIHIASSWDDGKLYYHSIDPDNSDTVTSVLVDTLDGTVDAYQYLSISQNYVKVVFILSHIVGEVYPKQVQIYKSNVARTSFTEITYSMSSVPPLTFLPTITDSSSDKNYYSLMPINVSASSDMMIITYNALYNVVYYYKYPYSGGALTLYKGSSLVIDSPESSVANQLASLWYKYSSVVYTMVAFSGTVSGAVRISVAVLHNSGIVNTYTVVQGGASSSYPAFGFARDPVTNRVYLVYLKYNTPTNTSIHYTYSDDNGVTWSAEHDYNIGVTGALEVLPIINIPPDSTSNDTRIFHVMPFDTAGGGGGGSISGYSHRTSPAFNNRTAIAELLYTLPRDGSATSDFTSARGAVTSLWDPRDNPY